MITLILSVRYPVGYSYFFLTNFSFNFNCYSDKIGFIKPKNCKNVELDSNVWVLRKI